jgi:hypothetical protein
MTAHSRAQYQPLFDSQRRGVSTWPDEPPDEREFEPLANGDFVEAGMSYRTETGRVEAYKATWRKMPLVASGYIKTLVLGSERCDAYSIRVGDFQVAFASRPNGVNVLRRELRNERWTTVYKNYEGDLLFPYLEMCDDARVGQVVMSVSINRPVQHRWRVLESSF